MCVPGWASGEIPNWLHSPHIFSQRQINNNRNMNKQVNNPRPQAHSKLPPKTREKNAGRCLRKASCEKRGCLAWLPIHNRARVNFESKTRQRRKTRRKRPRPEPHTHLRTQWSACISRLRSYSFAGAAPVRLSTRSQKTTRDDTKRERERESPSTRQ